MTSSTIATLIASGNTTQQQIDALKLEQFKLGMSYSAELIDKVQGDWKQCKHVILVEAENIASLPPMG